MAKIELSDFIAETLASISDGVRRAQDHCFETDGVPIAPPDIEGVPLREGDQLIKFSVLIEATSSSELAGQGKIGGPIISVIAGEINADGSKSASSSHSHKVEFSVPAYFNLRYRAHLSEGK